MQDTRFKATVLQEAAKTHPRLVLASCQWCELLVSSEMQRMLLHQPLKRPFPTLQALGP
jgi:hypothetical protein